ncbi:hypothetical protein yaldo0001_34550, partial [Yersinia aldovae ATCC 35236]
MSAIDITTMRGEMPRAVPHLLPEQAATMNIIRISWVRPL